MNRCWSLNPEEITHHNDWILDRFAFATRCIEEWKKDALLDPVENMVRRAIFEGKYSPETTDAFRTAFGL